MVASSYQAHRKRGPQSVSARRTGRARERLGLSTAVPRAPVSVDVRLSLRSRNMTTFAEESVVCGACGRVFTHHALASTNSFGSPDLDTRPPEMQRSTMHAWIQRCPSCGYCSRDASEFQDSLRAVLDSSEYRSQLADTRYPELASSFICSGMLADASERPDDAGWAYLHAAWVLDDARKDDLARLWRGKAADSFLAVVAEGHAFAAQPGASEAILIDCLRRAGRGGEALPLIERALSQNYEDIIHKILVLQRALIQRGDTAAHLVKEALETR